MEGLMKRRIFWDYAGFALITLVVVLALVNIIFMMARCAS